ncbi:hypothetical protein M3Y94_00146900 [Aphelenchoides besseyi]|nr:hypothetical protein M3Y94_00146900 [Aphelenchoides besseyi]
MTIQTTSVSTSLKVKFGTQKEYDFRCGDDGFQVYKCKPSAKELVHTGVAWFDRENVLNICQLT